jgi:hypothetical protein
VSFYYAALVLAGAALWMFAYAAERITDALDDEDVNIYVCTMLMYNVGVVLIFASVACLLLSYSEQWLAALFLVAMLFPWGWHIGWLLARYLNSTKMAEYVRELERDIR